MKKVIFLLSLMFLSTSLTNLYSQTGWVTVYSNPEINFYSISFVNAKTGFAMYIQFGGHSALLKTSDGGFNWTEIFSATAENLIKVNFINEQTGFMSGNPVPGNSGLIYKTTNGGVNWQRTTVNSDGSIISINFLNENTGYGRDQSQILKTTNGGLNWSPQPHPGDRISDFHFLNVNSGFATTSNGVILNTTNGGANWNIQASIHPSPLVSITFANSLTGFALDLHGGYLQTNNGGENWYQHYIDTSRGFTKISFANPSTGYATWTAGPIMKTTNGGGNWFTQAQSNTDGISDMFVINRDTVYCCTYSAKIIRTLTGGTIGIKPVSQSVPDKFSLMQNYPNPFNPNTVIKFDISQTSDTKLVIYNLLGKEVEVLVSEKLTAGSYQVQFNGSNLASGIYFYELITENFADKKKMVLIK